MSGFSFCIGDALEYAAKKIAIPGWEGCVWEHMEGGHLVTGEVPSGVYSKGPRKGRPKFIGKGPTHKKVVVSNIELEQEAATYESATGKCWNCKGTGEIVAGWSVVDGTKYRPCQRCRGAGA